MIPLRRAQSAVGALPLGFGPTLGRRLRLDEKAKGQIAKKLFAARRVWAHWLMSIVQQCRAGAVDVLFQPSAAELQ
jgi:hypothetical protein